MSESLYLNKKANSILLKHLLNFEKDTLPKTVLTLTTKKLFDTV